jgi:hypothetical protein
MRFDVIIEPRVNSIIRKKILSSTIGKDCYIDKIVHYGVVQGDIRLIFGLLLICRTQKANSTLKLIGKEIKC